MAEEAKQYWPAKRGFAAVVWDKALDTAEDITLHLRRKLLPQPEMLALSPDRLIKKTGEGRLRSVLNGIISGVSLGVAALDSLGSGIIWEGIYSVGLGSNYSKRCVLIGNVELISGSLRGIL